MSSTTRTETTRTRRWHLLHATLMGLAIIALAMAWLVVSSAPGEAHNGPCSSGEVCHYSSKNSLDPSLAHIEHEGSNDNWSSQFPAMDKNDWSVVNKGQAGMAVETINRRWGFGSRVYCVTNSGQGWLLKDSGGSGRAHFWFWAGANDCL